MKKILFFTRYALEGSVSGGGRRTRQIIEEFKEEDLLIHSAMQETVADPLQDVLNKGNDRIFTKTVSEKVRQFIQFYALGADYFRWEKSWRLAVFWMWRMAHTWIRTCKKTEDIDYVLLEDPFFYRPLTRYLLSRKIPVIAIIQNLETMFQHYCPDKHRFYLLDKELFWLKKCRLTLTNSREEASLLTNYSINNLFFPYYPASTAESSLLTIRKKRKEKTGKNFVLLGSAGNRATLEGMKELIQFWADAIHDETLLIVGHHSEELSSLANGRTIEYKGSLPEREFESVLAEAKAVICYQRQGPGALTRIADMLIAGVPIIANSHALRSYYNLEGIKEFQTLHEFQAIIASFDHNQVFSENVYQRPTGLRNRITELLSQEGNAKP